MSCLTRFFVRSLAAWTGLTLTGCALPASQAPADLTMAQTPSEQPAPIGQCRPPAWPPSLAQNLSPGYRSKTLLRFLVDANGLVRDAALVKSSGFSRLDKSAESALRLCRFKPAIQDGKPVEAWQPVEYEWTIEESKSNPAASGPAPGVQPRSQSK